MNTEISVPSDDEMIQRYRKGLTDALGKISEILDPLLASNPEFVPGAPGSIQAGAVMHALMIIGTMVAQTNNCTREQVLDILNGLRADVQDPTSPVFVQRTLTAS